jgi:hypothetical protein
MPNIRRNSSRLVHVAILIAPALLAFAAPATAQKLISKGDQPSDPVLLEGEGNSGPHDFFINDNTGREIVRFQSARNFEVCDGKKGGIASGRRRVAYPINVSADGQTSTVAPGACTTVNARSVTIAPGAQLADDDVLQGTVRQVPDPTNY